MYQTTLSRLVRAHLPRGRFPRIDRLRIEPYLYEIVAELPDSDAVAFLDGLALLENWGEANEIVRSVMSRIIESWRRHYNTRRPHSSLGYRPRHRR